MDGPATEPLQYLKDRRGPGSSSEVVELDRMPRYFTLEQARGILPSIAERLRNALALKQEYDRAESEADNISRQIALMGGMMVNRDRVVSLRTQREASATRLREIVGEIQDAGVQIKDLDIGLIDFPTLYRGDEVLLCWKLGEKDIEFWHGLTDGFRGRRPIDRDFLDNHRGDPV